MITASVRGAIAGAVAHWLELMEQTSPFIQHYDDMMIADVVKAAEDAGGPTHRHKASGRSYEKVGVARLQSHVTLPDMAEMVIYRGEDGQLWVRGATEFAERFEEEPT